MAPGRSPRGPRARPTGRRRLTFAGSTLTVEWDGRRAGEVVDFLFGLIPSGKAAPPEATFRVQSSGSGSLQIFRDGRLVCSNDTEGPAASVLLDQVVDLLTRTSKGGLVLHAAAFARRGRGIVVPAATRQGKTTLAAWLSAGSFECLTDELVHVPDGSHHIVPLPRPLRLRDQSRPILSARFPRWPPTERSLIALNTCLIPLTALGGGRRASPPDISLLMFSRYDPAGSGRLRPLSRAKAALKLMSSLLNAGNVDARGIREAARLARTIPACEISYRECSQVEAELVQWLDSATGASRRSRRKSTRVVPAAHA